MLPFEYLPEIWTHGPIDSPIDYDEPREPTPEEIETARMGVLIRKAAQTDQLARAGQRLSDLLHAAMGGTLDEDAAHDALVAWFDVSAGAR